MRMRRLRGPVSSAAVSTVPTTHGLAENRERTFPIEELFSTTRELRGLRALQLNGRVEAAVFGGVGARDVEAPFSRIREQLDEAADKTDGVETFVRRAALSRRAGESTGYHVERLSGLEAMLVR